MAAAADPELSDSQLKTSEMTQTVSHGGCLNMQPGRNEEPNEAATALLSPTRGCCSPTDGNDPAARGQACPKPFIQRNHSSSSRRW